MEKPTRKPTSIFDKACIFATIAVTLIYFIPFIWRLTQGKTLPDAPVTQVIIKNDRMIVQGTIDKVFAKKVHDALGQTHEAINVIFLSSIGGDEEAANSIARDLNKLGPHKTVIPSGHTCQSACISLVDDQNTDFQPADDATLMFHRAWGRLGPDSCAACRLVAWETNHLKDTFLGNTWHEEMFQWAENLVPGLGKRLSDCSPNPFDNIKGRTITGKQFKDFRAGQSEALACPV